VPERVKALLGLAELKIACARLWHAEGGQGLVEYSLLLVLIAVALIVALQFIAGGLSGDLSHIGSNV
jgi:Flp pilus assembly pilin Flp